MLAEAAAVGVSWETVLTAAVTALTTAVPAVLATIRLLLKHLERQRDAQRKHEEVMLQRIETMHQTCRTEATQMFHTLLGTHTKTVETVAGMSQRLGELSVAINELRGEVGRKMDRPNGGE